MMFMMITVRMVTTLGDDGGKKPTQSRLLYLAPTDLPASRHQSELNSSDLWGPGQLLPPKIT